MKVLTALKALVIGVLADEPVLVRAVAVVAVGSVAGALGIVVPTAGIEQIAGFVVLVLAGAVATRKKVTPS